MTAFGQHFGDSKVQQLRLTRFIDHNISWLQIPMDHQMLMREMDGRANCSEQFQALENRQAAGLAVLIEPHAFDVLHRQVRLSAVADAAKRRPSPSPPDRDSSHKISSVERRELLVRYGREIAFAKIRARVEGTNLASEKLADR
jgi:hypothetical protein